MQDWAQIRYLHASGGLSRRAIAARLGISRDTVARAVVSASPPRYERVSDPSAFDEFESHVRELLAEFPTIPASVIAERVGWSGSGFRKKVAELRPEYAPKDPADRLDYRPGDQAQCDLWFPPTRIPLGAATTRCWCWPASRAAGSELRGLIHDDIQLSAYALDLNPSRGSDRSCGRDPRQPHLHRRRPSHHHGLPQPAPNPAPAHLDRWLPRRNGPSTHRTTMAS